MIEPVMFQGQWTETAHKRAREDDEHGGGSLGFTEHRNKRLQSLPLRTSPAQKRQSDPPNFPTITPSDSGYKKWSPLANLQQQSPMDIDRDMDMMVDEGCQPQQPLVLQSDPSTSGRIPTPIHCSFAAQVRGTGWTPANHSAHTANQTLGTPGSRSRFSSNQDDSVPRSLGGSTEWSMVQDRRLPSPISEYGAEDTPQTPGMVLDSSSDMMPTLQRPHLPHLPHSSNPAAMLLHPNIRTPPRIQETVSEDSTEGVADAGMTDAVDAGTPTSAPASPSPRGKFGHSRSKHTLNSWTLQPGMKKSFSIGYRADCEKCRMKIPGHFNHIIVS